MAAILTPQRKVLAMAVSQIGYSRWKDSKNGTKYARETQPVFWPLDKWLLANGISFCDIFVTWVFWKALGEDFVTSGALPAGASYNTDYRASKGGRVSKPPRPGDVLVFDWNWATIATNHVGILEKVLPSGNYQTVEGNTSPGTSGSQGNGGGVYRRTRKPDQVRYVIRPNWAKASGSTASAPVATTPDPARPWRTSPRVAGYTKAEVQAIQQTLIAEGYPVGSYGADGSYGDDTGNAVKQLQQDLDLTADGVWGPATKEELMTLKKDIDWIRRVTEENQKRIEAGRLYPNKGAFREDIRDLIEKYVPRAGFDSGVTNSEGKAVEINVATGFRWAHDLGRQNREQIGAALGELKALGKAVEHLSGGQIDMTAIETAAREGAAHGAAEVEAREVAELLTLGVREVASDKGAED